MVNVNKARAGGKKLAKGVKGLTGSMNAKGFKGNGGTKKIVAEAKTVGKSTQKKARKMGF